MKDAKDKLIYAKDFKCPCGKQAEVFVGLADPDATDFPKCRDCADEWEIKLWLKLNEENDDE